MTTSWFVRTLCSAQSVHACVDATLDEYYDYARRRSRRDDAAHDCVDATLDEYYDCARR